MLHVGDEVDVKLLEIDPKTGKMRLSMRALTEKPEGYVEPERRPRPERGDRRDDRRGGRDERRGGERGDRRGERKERGEHRDFREERPRRSAPRHEAPVQEENDTEEVF